MINYYYCKGCNQVVTRESKLERIKSFCETSKKNHFLIKVEMKVKNLAQPDVSGSLPLTYGDKVKCSQQNNYKDFWRGTYIAKHPTKDAHIVLLRARPELRIEEEIDMFAYCQRQ